MKISVRDVGDAKVVEVEGDVDLGTSPVFRRTLFETLHRADETGTEPGGHPVHRQFRNRDPHRGTSGFAALEQGVRPVRAEPGGSRGFQAHPRDPDFSAYFRRSRRPWGLRDAVGRRGGSRNRAKRSLRRRAGGNVRQIAATSVRLSSETWPHGTAGRPRGNGRRRGRDPDHLADHLLCRSHHRVAGRLRTAETGSHAVGAAPGGHLDHSRTGTARDRDRRDRKVRLRLRRRDRNHAGDRGTGCPRRQWPSIPWLFSWCRNSWQWR